MRCSVLIETLWNVKIEAGCFTYCPDNSINRNIVECKVSQCVLIERRLGRINRYIVECKEYRKFSRKYSNNGINRNIVECKELVSQTVTYGGIVLIETLWNVKFFYDGIWRDRPEY